MVIIVKDKLTQKPIPTESTGTAWVDNNASIKVIAHIKGRKQSSIVLAILWREDQLTEAIEGNTVELK